MYSLEADKDTLTVTGPPVPADAAVSVLLHGRRIWSFRLPCCSSPDARGRFTVSWPPALAERLAGRAQLSLLLNGAPVSAASEVSFDATGVPFVLEEPGTGIPQVVNKWGRIARSFEGCDPSLIEGILDETEKLITLARERLGIALFVTGGTLLGPVRDGAIMPHDDDADLAYLSRHLNPSDVVLESFELERLLKAASYETVRHSAGHLQLMFPGGTLADSFYVDIFTYFTVNGWFHGPFHARERADKVPVFPLTTLDVNGRPLPAPASPELMLSAIYGPSWRTPDPAFRFVTPPAAARRFHGWLNSLDMDRENWEDHHRAQLASGRPAMQPSGFARLVCSRLSPGSTVLDLGCGFGADARLFAEHGHDVLAVDYSRPALLAAQALPSPVTEGRRPGQPPPGELRFRRVNLNSLRETAPLARSAGAHRPPGGPGEAAVHVYARLLLNALGPPGWDNVLTLIRHLLAPGTGRAFLEVQTGTRQDASSWNTYGSVDPGRLQHQLDRHQLTIEDCRQEPADGVAGTGSVQLSVKVGTG
jgi:SAM-dependent methyltransferase